jgi:hypothetical protein
MTAKLFAIPSRANASRAKSRACCSFVVGGAGALAFVVRRALRVVFLRALAIAAAAFYTTDQRVLKPDGVRNSKELNVFLTDSAGTYLAHASWPPCTPLKFGGGRRTLPNQQ